MSGKNDLIFPPDIKSTDCLGLFYRMQNKYFLGKINETFSFEKLYACKHNTLWDSSFFLFFVLKI